MTYISFVTKGGKIPAYDVNPILEKVHAWANLYAKVYSTIADLSSGDLVHYIEPILPMHVDTIPSRLYEFLSEGVLRTHSEKEFEEKVQSGTRRLLAWDIKRFCIKEIS